VRRAALSLGLILALAACGREDPQPSFAPADPAGGLFAPDHLVEVEIHIAEKDWEALRFQGRTWADVVTAHCREQPVANVFSYFPADVTVDGQKVERVGLRKKGFVGSLDTDKPALKMRFEQYVPGQTLRGLTHMVLNNSKQDLSFIKQCLSYQGFAAAGVPAPWCNFAHVTVNGRDLGLYINVESVDRRFLRRHFEDDHGDLWEGALSDFRVGWVGTFDKKGDLDVDLTDVDRSRLLVVANALQDATSDAELQTKLAGLIDLERFYSLWAAEKVLEHWDGYANGANNFYVYDDPKSGRLVFIPSGTDQIFAFEPWATDMPPVSVYARAMLSVRLYHAPDARARYVAKLREVLDTAFKESELLRETDRMQALIWPVLQRSGADLDAVGSAIEAVRRHVRSRRRLILDDIADGAQPWNSSARPFSCASQGLGRVEGSFATSFGSLGQPPFSGTGALNFDLYAQRIPFAHAGARGGWNPSAPPDPWIYIELRGLGSDGVHWIAGLKLHASQLVPGTRVALGNDLATGLVATWDPAAQRWRFIGHMSGALDFDQVSPQEGAPLSGRFSAWVYY
jgi:hypothetical protein